MIIDTARVVGSGSPFLTARRCLASAAPVRQCVHRPPLESERQAVSRKPIASCGSSFWASAAPVGLGVVESEANGKRPLGR
jgi:hypothetical protein